jgi:DNA-binding HxlR family transcriptional regulator
MDVTDPGVNLSVDLSQDPVDLSQEPVDLSQDRDAWSGENCSVLRALRVLGTRSTVLLLREAFLGTRRFDDFARRVGITESVAASRLRELVAEGLLERVPYREPGQRTRDEYRLTAKGRDTRPILIALREWGDRYLADAEGPPVAFTHRGCGQPLQLEIRCAGGHHVDGSEVMALVGPGARRAGQSD